MTKGEIITSYRQAKCKTSQIKILAELTCKSKDEIKDILRAAGEEIPVDRRGRKASVSKKSEKKAEEDKPITIGRNEDGIITVVEPSEEPNEETERKVSFTEEMPEHVRELLINELRKLDTEIEAIQKKKAQIVAFMYR